ncbi:MAG: hypothetical protein H6508_01385 [Calditrichaeota bacterium]|nr:hypothetical protein [Calditrichota bacterium]MCB9365829.1 hypothetical protein [Calditrichota bacterium]
MKKTLLLLLFPAVLWAQSSSENFTLTKSVMDAGGGASSSANFGLVSAFGQPTPIGVQTSENFTLYAGFLSPSLGVSPLSPIQQLVIHEATPDALLYWEAISGAGSYSIHRAATFNFVPDGSNLIGTTSNTTFTDTNVLAGPETQQYYIVKVNP